MLVRHCISSSALYKRNYLKLGQYFRGRGLIDSYYCLGLSALHPHFFLLQVLNNEMPFFNVLLMVCCIASIIYCSGRFQL